MNFGALPWKSPEHFQSSDPVGSVTSSTSLTTQKQPTQSAAMGSNEAESAELAHVRSFWARMCPQSPIYTFLLKDLQLVSALHGTVKGHLELQHVHINSKGTLHGAVSACITDCFGGLAIASTGMDQTGVSTDIHTTYVSSAKLGATLQIEAKAHKVGRSFGFSLSHYSRDVLQLAALPESENADSRLYYRKKSGIHDRGDQA